MWPWSQIPPPLSCRPGSTTTTAPPLRSVHCLFSCPANEAVIPGACSYHYKLRSALRGKVVRQPSLTGPSPRPPDLLFMLGQRRPSAYKDRRARLRTVSSYDFPPRADLHDDELPDYPCQLMLRLPGRTGTATSANWSFKHSGSQPILFTIRF
jgi:hypothetical protein